MMLRASEVPKFDATEMLKDILTAKLALALPGFGTFIWGWGTYGWWSFGYLMVWAFFVLRDAYRDHVHLQNREAAAAVSKALQG